MNKLDWDTVSQQYLIRDQWINLRADVCKMPGGKIVEPYYVLEYPDWVNVTAITDQEEIVLIRQYRHAYGEVVLELPGGVVDAGESYATAARRELLEETGYTAESFEELARTSPNPSNQTNLSISYLATGAKKVSRQELDNTEDIEIVVMPLEEVVQLLKSNRIVQAMHVTSLYYVLQKLGKL